MKAFRIIFIFWATWLFFGCNTDSKKSTDQEIIGVWRTNDRKLYNAQITITRIDAGMIWMERIWPIDPNEGVSSENKWPIIKNKDGSWHGEYHGPKGLAFVDIKSVFRIEGRTLRENRKTRTSGNGWSPKDWDENFSYKREN